MEKKIKDLNFTEMLKICDNWHNKFDDCMLCPLSIGDGYCFKYLDLDEKVEIPEVNKK